MFGCECVSMHVCMRARACVCVSLCVGCGVVGGGGEKLIQSSLGQRHVMNKHAAYT